MLKRAIAALSLALCPMVSSAQILVSDPWQLAHQAEMLVSQARELERYAQSFVGASQGSVEDLRLLLGATEGLTFERDALEQAFQQFFPEAYEAGVSIERLIQDGRETARLARESDRDVLAAIGQSMGALEQDLATLQSLTGASLGAVGGLQAEQVGNDLAAFNAQQTLQLRMLLAAEAKAQALERAREHAARERGRARLERFLEGADAPYSSR